MPELCSGSTATTPDARFRSTGRRTNSAVLYVISGEVHETKNSSSVQPGGRSACNTATNPGDALVSCTGPSTVGTHAAPLIAAPARGAASMAASAWGAPMEIVVTHAARATKTSRDRCNKRLRVDDRVVVQDAPLVAHPVING